MTLRTMLQPSRAAALATVLFVGSALVATASPVHHATRAAQRTRRPALPPAAHRPMLRVGSAAPDFIVTDTRGRERSLATYRGKWVVLEWFSYACPFTMKQYGTGNMQAMQREYTKRGVIWLSINSSAPGKEGFATPSALNSAAAAQHASATAIIRDTSGTLGHLYGATNTPQVFVIDPAGVLRYAGAVDDQPTARREDVARAHNYVRAALDAGLAAKSIAIPQTQPYGCTVQY